MAKKKVVTSKGCNRCNQWHSEARCPNCNCLEYRLIYKELPKPNKKVKKKRARRKTTK